METETKHVTNQDLIDFIFDQPEDRELMMHESSSFDECGCVMIHYGKEILKIEEKFGAGYTCWSSDRKDYAYLESFINNIVSMPWKEVENYGDVQRFFMNNGVYPSKKD